MKIIKNLIAKNEKTELVSQVFDECFKELNYRFFERIELHLSYDDKARLEFPNAFIYLNYNNPFVQGSDKKAIKVMMLRQFISLAILWKYPEKQIPGFIMEILANREMIKRGYGKDLFYYYFILLLQHEPQKIQEFGTYLKINIPWLSYSVFDAYDTEALKEITDSFNYLKEFEPRARNLFLALNRDILEEKNLDNATKAYQETVAGNNG